MTSILCAIGIIYTIFWGIFLLKKSSYIPNYSKYELIVFYFFARVVPILMVQQHNMQIWQNLFMDMAVFAFLIYYVKHKKDNKVHGCIYSCYIFQPGAILSVLYGNHWYMLVILFLLMLLCICDAYMQKRGGSLLAFLPEYIVGSIGIYIWFVATKVYGQKISAINNETEIPVLYIVSLAVMLSVAILCINRICKCYYKISNVQWEEKAEEKCDCWIEKENKLEVKDILLMILFTSIFAVVVLFKIGSFRVPETYHVLKQGQTGSNEIILAFDSEVTLSKVYIYLGYQGKREISFSYINDQNTNWTVLDSGHIVDSAFCWNEVKIDHSLKQLGMVLLKDDANIHEVICLDQYGRRVLPSNAGYYSQLFDEQALFPENRTYFYRTMFDEVYHARTAYEFLNQLPIYENTHPPLGKSIISIGIKAFGMNPFGWRIMCALCGILMVPIMYLFAHKMFGTTEAASFVTILLCTEFMHFTLSRIATIDIIVALFVLLMFFFMYCFVKECDVRNHFRKQIGLLFLCGVSMALAISTKWTGVYAAIGIAIIFFTYLYNQLGGIQAVKNNAKYLAGVFGCCCVCFIVIPTVIYSLSYIPFIKVYTDKGILQTVIDNANLMLTYHVDTVFDHPYSSEWYEWLIDKRPLLDSYTVMNDGTISTIVTFGNPLILWAGLLALFHQFYLWRCKKCKNAQYLVLAYISVVMPWLFIHRTVFIYQYCLGILIVIMMIGNSFCHIKQATKLMIISSIISAGLFALFYPVISGIPIEGEFMSQVLEWMDTWKFLL